VQPRITLVTLGVDDLERALAFYRDGLGLATQGIVGAQFENGAVAFFELEAGLKLALWPRSSLAADSGLVQQPPSATEFSLAHNVGSPLEVDAVMRQASAAGARIVKPAQATFYGGYAGCFQDPDGHLWEVAHNPGFALEAENLATVRAYLQALERAAVGEELAAFLAPDAVQVELPNRLNPNGGRSDLATLLKRAAKVPDLLSAQRYEVVSELASGARVDVEALWSGTLAVAFGAIPAGTTLKAHLAMVFELQHGRIRAQRNYDCFEPW